MQRQDIKNFTLNELEKVILGIGEKPYRAKQIFFGIYRKYLCRFQEMKNLPKELIGRLNQRYYVGDLELDKHLKSSDGTEKFLYKLRDGNFIETVLICSGNRKTLCLSTQLGCKFGCAFCASGRIGLVRDLTPSEIVNQILFLRQDFKYKITNYVFMGMGEPLDNYENTLKAVRIMNEPSGLEIGARRITISTCGVIPGIDRLKDSGLQVNLSVSLHTTDNKLRDELVPINRRYPLEELVKVCKKYIAKTGRKITLEYILIKDKNHSLQDADKLAEIAKDLKAKVNLIRCSTISVLSYKSPGEKQVKIFMERLAKKGVNSTLRKSKGSDIQAACGQLAGRKIEKI